MPYHHRLPADFEADVIIAGGKSQISSTNGAADIRFKAVSQDASWADDLPKQIETSRS